MVKVATKRLVMAGISTVTLDFVIQWLALILMALTTADPKEWGNFNTSIFRTLTRAK